MGEKMVVLNGALVPAERECELCDQLKPTLELEWYTVHNHPFWYVCPECKAKMDTCKSLPKCRARDRADAVEVKK